MVGKWHVELLGRLALQSGSVVQTRFYSHKVAFLLAWLAYHPNHLFARDEIIELLWPDSALRSGRASLRQALAMLRRHIEPVGTPFGTVLLADYSHIGLNAEAFTTDVGQFESCLDRAWDSTDLSEQAIQLQSAVRRYSGDLLPGFYEDWALSERGRLTQRVRSALARIVDLAERQGDQPTALDYSWRLTGMEPGNEEAHLTLIRILVEAGQLQAAQQQYETLWHILVDETGEPPSNTIQSRAHQWKLRAPSVRTVSSISRNSRTDSVRSKPEAVSSVLPPLSPSPESHVNLPLLLTPTFGRDVEIKRLCTQLRNPQVRLLTVTGLGGVGKTRLVLESLRTQEFDGRCIFVRLTGISQAQALPEHLLRALSLYPAPNLPIEEQLVSALAGEATLLVLDNFEQLIDGGAELVYSLLTRLPKLKCLITSRQRLNVDGEYTFALEPLPLPEAESSLDQLADCASVQLLVDRVRSVRPEFQLTARNAAAVAMICRQLEGLPLAIELAAARLPTVSITQMPALLEQKLTFLVGRKRNVSTRDRSIRAMLDWSFQLLSPLEQQFLANLSVFRGGWTLEAADKICQDELALEKLEGLCACSLLTIDETDGGVRYRMLEIVREYAAEKMSQEKTADAIRERHYAYFTELAETAACYLDAGKNSAYWLDRLEQERPNFLAALDWCLKQSAQRGLRLTVALTSFWQQRSYLEEGRSWFDACLHLPDLIDDLKDDFTLYVQALLGAGKLAQEQGDLLQAYAFFTEGLVKARRLALRSEIADALVCLGQTLEYRGDYAEAIPLIEEGLEISRGIGDASRTARALSVMGNTYFMQGNFIQCAFQYEASLKLYEELNNAERTVILRGNLGLVRMELGNYEEAVRDINWSLLAHRQNRSQRALAIGLNNLGYAYLRLKNWDAARKALDESLQILRHQQNRRSLSIVLNSLRQLLSCQGDYIGSAQLAGEVLSLCQASGLNDKPIVAECLVALADSATTRKDWEQAARLYSMIDSLQRLSSKADPFWSSESYRCQRQAAKCAVGDAVWESYQCGFKGISWDQAVSLALRFL